MITDSYDIETEPMINLFDFYGRRGDFADICLIIFSKEIHRHLLDSYESEIIATMSACNGDTHIYKTTYKGVTITFYLSGIGSAVASSPRGCRDSGCLHHRLHRQRFHLQAGRRSR